MDKENSHTDNRNPAIVAAAIVLAAGLVIASHVWSSHNRYYIISTGNMAYEVDRKTGETWFLSRKNKEPHSW